MKNNYKLKFFKFFNIILPFVYSILYAPYGYDGYDTGVIQGLSWQFFNGAIPYKDIIFVRPPVSYMFHSIFFYLGDYAFLINRSFFYIQIACYSYLTIFLLAKKFDYRNSTFIYFLSTISFMFSAHTFPPMAWHTVDGIFFSVIGIYFILNFQNSLLVILGSLFTLLGALSKQPYYIVPFITIVFLYFHKDYKKLLIYFSSVCLFVFIFFLYLYQNKAFYEFISQTFGQTKLNDLIKSGFVSYIFSIKDLFFVFLPPIIIYFLMKVIISKIRIEFFYLIILWILMFMLNTYLNVNTFISIAYNYSQLLFIFSTIYTLIKFILYKESKYAIALLFLLISWASSISWGYNLTIFFMAPILFVLAIPTIDNFENKLSLLKMIIIVIFSFYTFNIGYQHPYSLDHPNTREELTYHLGDIFTKAKYIYVDFSTYEEYLELRKLINKYGENFVVLPASTSIHFLTNTHNPIGIDWVMNCETNNSKDSIIKNLEKNNITVILKKSNLNPDGPYGSEITYYIYNNWEIIYEGVVFNVYKYIEK